MKFSVDGERFMDCGKISFSGDHATVTCKCGYEATRSQYGRDDYCPRCGMEIDWSGEADG